MLLLPHSRYIHDHYQEKCGKSWILCSSYRKGNLRVTLDYGRQIYFTLHKMDLALNNLQWLICHKTQQTKPNQDCQIKVMSKAVSNSKRIRILLKETETFCGTQIQHWKSLIPNVNFFACNMGYSQIFLRLALNKNRKIQLPRGNKSFPCVSVCGINYIYIFARIRMGIMTIITKITWRRKSFLWTLLLWTCVNVVVKPSLHLFFKV